MIHTVGPVWNGGGAGEEELLARCYCRSLEVAVDNGVQTIAFPAISTGVYRFPPDLGAAIAVATVSEFLAGNGSIAEVVFCCFGQGSVSAHERAMADAPSL